MTASDIDWAKPRGYKHLRGLRFFPVVCFPFWCFLHVEFSCVGQSVLKTEPIAGLCYDPSLFAVLLFYFLIKPLPSLLRSSGTARDNRRGDSRGKPLRSDPRGHCILCDCCG
ncbi:hypothetical protein QBC36DRAFT_107147 [Triangularia setosa]|uniref:Uncharacterized protein n=1 Tax=Triangularia setosa TaxID=2587417 RepID=A0AAN7AAE8_9PEZI|nr:hypothetical protein QBC36DRAFT_107147 [Podospora setosa]